MAAPKSTDEPIAIDALDARRRRLRYRAWHRGTREMDLVLGPFADAHASLFDQPALDALEGLMDESDPDLLKWVMGQEMPPAHIDRELLARLVAFRQTVAAAQQ